VITEDRDGKEKCKIGKQELPSCDVLVDPEKHDPCPDWIVQDVDAIACLSKLDEELST
jgi:hypothetical protein